MSTAIIKFNFKGDDLEVVALPDGDVGLALRPLCEDVLGVDFEGQRQRLARAARAGARWATACVMQAVGADGRTRQMLVLPRASIPMFTATLDAERIPADRRPKIVAGRWQDDAIREEREIRAMKHASAREHLADATLPELLLHGLAIQADGAESGRWILRDLRTDLHTFALVTATDPEHAADVLSLSDDIGPALEGFVRRLDVALELMRRIEAGRECRRARKAAAKSGVAR